MDFVRAVIGGGDQRSIAAADPEELAQLVRDSVQTDVPTEVVKGSLSVKGTMQTAAALSSGGAAAAGAAAASGAASAASAGLGGAHSSSNDPESGKPLLGGGEGRPAKASLSGGGAGGGGGAGAGTPQWLLTVAYGLTNLSSVVMIVVANKMVLFTHKFSFVVTLTFLHSLFTAVGMAAMAAGGLFTVKPISPRHSVPIAAVYVGFIVFNNLSIQINPLGFYQMSKLAITPVVVAIEWLAYGKTVSARVLGSIAVLLVGITLCSVTDSQVSSNLQGILAAIAAVLVASLYQVWAGTKQKELGLNGMQLLQQVSPMSVGLLAFLIPILEPVGWRDPRPGTILGYTFTTKAVSWILISSALGLVVTLSTFLFIGATSSLTYNVVGHLKTLLIVAAGVLMFGEEIGLKKGLGLITAVAGIVWYTNIRMEETRKPPPTDSKG
jgi:solute carrier family 35 protein E3